MLRLVERDHQLTEHGNDITRMLAQVRVGDASWSELCDLVYAEVHGIASRQMQRERGDHTLSATALAHEAFLRVSGVEEITFESRRHFFGAVAESMRRVLVDHARRVQADKRGGGRERMEITLGDLADQGSPEEFLALHDALEQLAREDERAAEVTKLRFYVGLGVTEVADALGIGERTVRREWAFARARLSELLGGGQVGGGQIGGGQVP